MKTPCAQMCVSTVVERRMTQLSIAEAHMRPKDAKWRWRKPPLELLYLRIEKLMERLRVRRGIICVVREIRKSKAAVCY